MPPPPELPESDDDDELDLLDPSTLDSWLVRACLAVAAVVIRIRSLQVPPSMMFMSGAGPINVISKRSSNPQARRNMLNNRFYTEAGEQAPQLDTSNLVWSDLGVLLGRRRRLLRRPTRLWLKRSNPTPHPPGVLRYSRARCPSLPGGQSWVKTAFTSNAEKIAWQPR